MDSFERIDTLDELGYGDSDEPDSVVPSGNPGLFQDIPGWIWRTYLAGWTALFSLFVLFFAKDGGSAFAITIASLFALMAFGLPMTIAAQTNREGYRCEGMIQTGSGPLAARAAATQILLIPISAVIGLTVLIICTR